MSKEVMTRARTPRAILVFLILAFPLSWYPWIWVLLGHRGNGGPNPLGVLAAALIATAVASGWRGPRDILLGLVRIRAPLLCWGTALFLPGLLVAASLVIAATQGAHIAYKPPPWSDLLDRFVFTFLFVALGEEPGWRGFLLPALQRFVHPLVATLVVAGVWAFWHLPLMGTEFAWPLVPAFLLSVFGGAFVLSWLFNASRKSILLPMITHANINTIGAGYAFHFIGGEDLVRLWWIYGAAWLVAGFIFVVATRGRLGLKLIPDG